MIIKSDGEAIVFSTRGKYLLCPGFPDPCTYIRIARFTADGREWEELQYWDQEEWREDPAGVMGAIMGAIISMQD